MDKLDLFKTKRATLSNNAYVPSSGHKRNYSGT